MSGFSRHAFKRPFRDGVKWSRKLRVGAKILEGSNESITALGRDDAVMKDVRTGNGECLEAGAQASIRDRLSLDSQKLEDPLECPQFIQSRLR